MRSLTRMDDGLRAKHESSGPSPSREPGAVEGNDRALWGEFLAAHRGRLRHMVALRLDERVRGRIDPSDVIQEAFLEATERRPEYARDPDPMPPFLWLRFLTLQRLQIAHRRHLGTHARDAGREVSIHARPTCDASSAAIALQLLGRDTRASHAAIRAERQARLQAALESMEPIDRELLVMRTSSNSPTASARVRWGLPNRP